MTIDSRAQKRRKRHWFTTIHQHTLEMSYQCYRCTFGDKEPPWNNWSMLILFMPEAFFMLCIFEFTGTRCVESRSWEVWPLAMSFWTTFLDRLMSPSILNFNISLQGKLIHWTELFIYKAACMASVSNSKSINIDRPFTLVVQIKHVFFFLTKQSQKLISMKEYLITVFIK